MVPIATFLSANFFYRVVFLCKSFCNSSLAALYEWFSHDTKCRQWIKWSVCIWKHSIGAVLRLIYRVGNRAGRVKPFSRVESSHFKMGPSRVESSRVKSSYFDHLFLFSWFCETRTKRSVGVYMGRNSKLSPFCPHRHDSHLSNDLSQAWQTT
jgi:hypothetical protein